MGWFNSRGDRPKEKKKSKKMTKEHIKKIETALLVQILKFDLNLETNPILSIEARFTRENTNDIGDALLPQTTQIIMMEFKKFMFLQALDILKNRKLDKKSKPKKSIILDRNESSIKDTFNFDSPFVAPPYIDRAWRLFILYNKNYEEFCLKIWGGFIDRNDPREDQVLSFKKYWDCINSLDEKKDLLKPFHNLWPRYNNSEEYMTDFEFNWYMSSEGIPQVIQYMSSRWTETENKSIEVEAWKELAKQCRNYYQVSSPPVETKLKIVTNNKVDHPYFNEKSQTPMQILNKTLSLTFPKKFVENLMDEHLIDINTANRWVLEYRKYLVMSYLTNKIISPSEQVDQVWHFHQTYTQHYRATWQALLEKEFKHIPSNGSKTDSDKYEGIYGDTLGFYEAIFLSDPPDDVWEPIALRFNHKNFNFKYINLYRLAVVYSMKVSNPDFLVPSAPPPNKNKKPDAKKIGTNDKKLILRQNRREYYQNKNTNFGWRSNFNGNKNVYSPAYNSGGIIHVHSGSEEEHKEHKHWNHHNHYDPCCPDCKKADDIGNINEPKVDDQHKNEENPDDNKKEEESNKKEDDGKKDDH